MLLGKSEEDGYSREYGQFFFCCFAHLKDCVSHCLWIKSPLIAIGLKVAPYLTAKTGYGVKQLRSPSAWTWTVCTKFLSCKNLSLSPFILWILLIPYDRWIANPASLWEHCHTCNGVHTEFGKELWTTGMMAGGFHKTVSTEALYKQSPEKSKRGFWADLSNFF